MTRPPAQAWSASAAQAAVDAGMRGGHLGGVGERVGQCVGPGIGGQQRRGRAGEEVVSAHGPIIARAAPGGRTRRGRWKAADGTLPCRSSASRQRERVRGSDPESRNADPVISATSGPDGTAPTCRPLR